MDTCFIFGAETFYGRRRKPQPGEYIIAANAGLRTCQQMGLTSVFCLGGNAHGVDLEGGQYPLHDATLTAGVSSGGQQPHRGVPGPCQRLARLFCRMRQMYPPKSMKRFPGCVTTGSELTVPTGDDFMNKPLQQDAISQAIGKSY